MLAPFLISPFAETKANSLGAGVYSKLLGRSVWLDSGANELVAHAFGESGPGTPLAIDLPVSPTGSAGDVYPYVGLGLALKQRGHHVTLATSGYFEDVCRRVELPFVDAFPREQYLELTRDTQLWHPLRGPSRVFRKGGIPISTTLSL